jgi:hypothetical protein
MKKKTKIKPRNPLVRKPKVSGAGAHKDKRKQIKHKKNLIDL